ncbi:hypothetical protein B0A49_11595 [Cryomyces minteri]|uniref:Glycerol-1-phosphate phosphohydrolase 1 n=1 Tax=Cryomyces minteri TaxID=331657 RepID=A0A4U0WIC2_9PEZI|nr:hypothetical protein B0A49_11595 [Cryomyces minteri]
MDGTVIDSTPAIVKHWYKIGKEIGVDPEVILASSHGRRTIEVLELYAPRLATWDYVSRAEGIIPKEFGHDAIELPGSRALLDNLEKAGTPWTIVTSGTKPLVTGWFNVMGLPLPDHLVSAEQVRKGKPDPECYRLGAARLGLDRHAGDELLVLEDAPAGVMAGKAAGFKVVALATTHEIEKLRQAGADWIVRDLASVKFKAWDGKSKKVEVEICDALVEA